MKSLFLSGYGLSVSVKKTRLVFKQGIVVLSNELKRKYIDLLSTILDRKRDYKARSGIRRSDGNQRMEEITIMKMKCIELKEFLMNQQSKDSSVLLH